MNIQQIALGIMMTMTTATKTGKFKSNRENPTAEVLVPLRKMMLMSLHQQNSVSSSVMTLTLKILTTFS